MKRIQFIKLLLCAMICSTSAHAQIGYQVSLLNTATGEPRANVTVHATIIITNSDDELIYSSTQPSTSNDFGVLTFTIGNEDTFKDADWNKLPFFIEVQVDGNTIGKSQILTVPVAEYAKKTGQLTKEMLVGTWVFDVHAVCDKEDYEWVYNGPDDQYGTKVYYTYQYHTHDKAILVFKNNGTCEFDTYDDLWTVGYRGYGGDYSYSHHSWSVSGTYFIDANEVIIITKINQRWFGENSSNPRADTDKCNSLEFHYIPEENILCGGGLVSPTGTNLPLIKQ